MDIRLEEGTPDQLSALMNDENNVNESRSRANILTLAWTGTTTRTPVKCSVAFTRMRGFRGISGGGMNTRHNEVVERKRWRSNSYAVQETAFGQARQCRTPLSCCG
jgi:hypothetical protein